MPAPCEPEIRSRSSPERACAGTANEPPTRLPHGRGHHQRCWRRNRNPPPARTETVPRAQRPSAHAGAPSAPRERLRATLHLSVCGGGAGTQRGKRPRADYHWYAGRDRPRCCTSVCSPSAASCTSLDAATRQPDTIEMATVNRAATTVTKSITALRCYRRLAALSNRLVSFCDKIYLSRSCGA